MTITSSPSAQCMGGPGGEISGLAGNVDADSTMVVLYACTDRYYVQPFTSGTGTPIACPSGAFANTTHGGCTYWAILAKKSWVPPADTTALPAIGGPILDIACSVGSVTCAEPLAFAGLTWEVKSSCVPADPGGNFFSGATENARVDSLGRLHLAITSRDGRWYCAEVLTREYLGYGRYLFEIEGPIDSLDRNAVLGCFSYSDRFATDFDEIDIELGRWGAVSGPNEQFCVQDSGGISRCDRFDLALTGTKSTHELIWMPDRIQFTSRQGAMDADGPLVRRWIYTGPNIPVPDFERIRFNLWLTQGGGPAGQQPVEAIVSGFRFQDVAGVSRHRVPRPGVVLNGVAPNPTTGAISCVVTLPEAARVRVSVLDVGGRLVRELMHERLAAGRHSLSWLLARGAGKPLGAGVYFLSVEAAGGRQARPFLIRR